MSGIWLTLCARPRRRDSTELVNNAGAAFSSNALSPDGCERTIAINHVALAALTDGLLDLLRNGAGDLAPLSSQRPGTASRVDCRYSAVLSASEIGCSAFPCHQLSPAAIGRWSLPVAGSTHELWGCRSLTRI